MASTATPPSKVLIIGATGLRGKLGEYVTKACVAAGHPTYVLVRTPTLSDPAKAHILDEYRELRITILEGSLEDHHSLVNALKQVEVVISTVSPDYFAQVALLPAIKEAGTIKRFFPSEFGMDVDSVKLLQPLAGYLGQKTKFRREVEKAGIPFTYVNNACFATMFLASFFQHGQFWRPSPPKDTVEIFGDGEAKVSLLDEADIATYTIKAIDDPRTLNKVLSVRPELISVNEIVAIWEKKIGHPLEKTYTTREDLIKEISELAGQPLVLGPGGTPPKVAILCMRIALFVDGNLGVEATPNCVEVRDLYPEYKFTTTDQYLDQFL